MRQFKELAHDFDFVESAHQMNSTRAFSTSIAQCAWVKHRRRSVLNRVEYRFWGNECEENTDLDARQNII